MIYTKAEIVELWKSVHPMPVMGDSNIPMLSSADVRRGSGLTCPKCGKTTVHVLTRVNGMWACNVCNNTEIKKAKWHKPFVAHIITNDLFSYFGDNLSSEALFNPAMVDGFIMFAKYRENPRLCLMFTSLLNAILARETSALKIIPYMSKIQKEMEGALKVSPEVQPLAVSEEAK
jgi:ribosomal protein L37AE/L43A